MCKPSVLDNDLDTLLATDSAVMARLWAAPACSLRCCGIRALIFPNFVWVCQVAAVMGRAGAGLVVMDLDLNTQHCRSK